MRRSTVIAALLLAWPLCAQPNILTGNYGNSRTNANLAETILNPDSVSPETFGKIGAYPVDGHVFTQPLYMRDVAIKGELKNVLYVATMHNSVYAFDADNPQGSEPLWKVNLGPPLPTSYYRRFSDIEKEIGILSTPVIDPATHTIYLVTCTYLDEKPVFSLNALDLRDGTDKPGSPVEITAATPGMGDNSDGKLVHFDPIQHIQRPGLLLANGSVYIAFGSHNDEYPFHGWIVAYNAADIRHQTAVFNSTPNGSQGAIWQSGRGLAADDAGNIYVSTANGDNDGQSNFSQSILKLSPGLQLVDWFTPDNWSQLSDDDSDLSSLGPVLIPGSGRLIGGDKDGNLYVVNPNNMGRLGAIQSEGVQTARPVAYGGIYNVAIWPRATGSMLYVTSEGDMTSQLRLTDGKVESVPVATANVAGDAPFQGMAISADGDRDESGIFWISYGDYSREGAPAIVCALEARNISNLLWCSNIYEDRDAPGRFAKFVSPTVVNGRVYVPTFSFEIAVYGLLPDRN